MNSFVFAHYNIFKHIKVGTAKSHMVQCERKICTGSVTQAGIMQKQEKRVDIYKNASVACALRVQDRLFGTCAGRQRDEKGLTFIIVEDGKRENIIFYTIIVSHQSSTTISKRFIRHNSLYRLLHKSYEKTTSKMRRSERIRKDRKEPKARRDAQKDSAMIARKMRRSVRLYEYRE